MHEVEPKKNENGRRPSGGMKIPDLVFVDIETTGTDPEMHDIIELAVIRVQQKWTAGEKPVFEIVDEWSQKVLPENISSADPAALRINGYTVSGWTKAGRIKPALKEFARRTDGAIMVAHNVAFDAGFLDRVMHDYFVEHSMHYHRLDTVSMAYAKLHSTPDVARYSLGELCKYFGIVNENAHSALADARACFELFKKLIDVV